MKESRMADTPSSTLPSSRQVFAHIQASVLDGTGITFVYAEDAIHEWPFPMQGSPGRLSGRTQITAFFDRIRGDRASRLRFEEFTDVVVHDTTDPEVIVAEYDIRGTITSTGRPFVFSYILVLRVHDGQIVSLRDYLNPLAMSEALEEPLSIDETPTAATVSPPASHLDLLERPLFAHVATVRPDGSPQSNVMWFAWDDPVVHLTHSRGGQKFQNLSRTPSSHSQSRIPTTPTAISRSAGNSPPPTTIRKGRSSHSSPSDTTARYASRPPSSKVECAWSLDRPGSTP
jgi:ketosteroid isomerase-like protein